MNNNNNILNRTTNTTSKYNNCYFSNVPLGESSIRQLFEVIIPATNDVTNNKTISFIDRNIMDWSILNTIFESLIKSLQPFKITFNITTTLSILMLILASIMLYFTTHALLYGKSNNKHHCNEFLQYITGLLAFLLLISTILCIILLIGATMTTDFCVDNPDISIQSYIDTKFANVQSTIFNQTTTWITNSRSISYPELEFRNWITTIDNNLDRIRVFENEISNFTQTNDFLMICGSDPDYWINTSSHLLYDDDNNRICDSVQTLGNIISSISYPTWNRIYTDTIHTGICYHGAIGFTVVTICQFCIVLFGMIMLTFRAGFYEIE